MLMLIVFMLPQVCFGVAGSMRSGCHCSPNKDFECYCCHKPDSEARHKETAPGPCYYKGGCGGMDSGGPLSPVQSDPVLTISSYLLTPIILSVLFHQSEQLSLPIDLSLIEKPPA